MATAELVLGLLSGGAAHGYDVKRGHDAWFPDSRPLAFGQVYSTLARLERDGLVEVAERTAGGGPDRRVFAITEKGRKHLEDWLADPVPPAWGTADEMLRKLVAALRTGGDPTAFLARQRANHLRRIRELQDAPPAGDPTAHLVRSYLVAHLDADLRWLDSALERLTDDKETS
ncbi:transcriptional regulator, PadR-like family [Kribbella flavida DSM 17836]|uniref:Transcriptional regulator, PadR-like family n=1 Tax=Kribbella flavida (strain DSM 17836 / JCM 10339 / NBRC 14399) TaxID=479435 RepID=D2Q0W5_KRIFD|nr:PadR family transcriptional regulator [Kribbella flavida]ADB35666.1 transcriptional regulator, PadR-like family [Kribbella flavida DSM 17836]